MIKEIKQGETLIAKGPTRLNLLEGRVEIFGKLVDADQTGSSKENETPDTELIIPSADQYPIYALQDSKLDIYTSKPKENLKIIEDNSIPKEWRDIKDDIIKKMEKTKNDMPLKIMVLGLSHGKTTLLKYLANNLIREGFQGGYIDSDLGQQIMYIPTTINIGTIENPIISGEDIDPEVTKFIGATYPKADLKFIVSHAANNLIEEYIEKYHDTEFILIDTDGWIKSEAGVIYKTFFIKTVAPDVVIAFHSDDEVEELETIEKKVKSDKEKELFLIKNENSYYYEKNKEDRRFLRQSRFSKVLEDFQKITIELDDIVFVKNEYDKDENEITEKEINIEELVQLPYHYVLISLLDEDSKMVNIGLLFSIDLQKKYFLIFSDLSYSEQLKIKKVLIGSLRLSTKGNHQGYLYL